MKTNDKITTRLNQLAGVTGPESRNEFKEDKPFGVKIQCTDSKGVTGSFVYDKETGGEITPTFVDCHELFRSLEYQAVRDKVGY